MAGRYYLTDSDRKLLQDVKTRVFGGRTTTRGVPSRRTPRSEGGSSLEWAMLVGVIPKHSAIDGTLFTATPGIEVTPSVHLMVWNGVDLEADADSTIVTGINGSGTDIRASPAEPILALGFRETVNDVDSFIVVNVMDFRGLPNYDVTKMQIPYHDAGSGDHKLAAEACP